MWWAAAGVPRASLFPPGLSRTLGGRRPNERTGAEGLVDTCQPIAIGFIPSRPGPLKLEVRVTGGGEMELGHPVPSFEESFLRFFPLIRRNQSCSQTT